MRLNELTKGIKTLQIAGDADIDITGVNIDSRKIKPGHLFVAMKGTQVDGHTFIPKALELGAAAVLRGKSGDPVLWRPKHETETGGRDRYQRKDHHRHLII